ncbi:hypothetical protein [Sphaerisporangium perillae]|uniref:hypothetical protein n=1 Tax=Sphaerisporangium perillae TaxID=2935860 RepID=UPI00200FEAEF|nr:hypothetical protein [Sphaerisporangium perillae]
MGTTCRWPIAMACLALAAACGGGPAGTPATRPAANPATPASTAPPGGPSAGGTSPVGASPAATGEIAASPDWKTVPGARLEGSAALLDVAAAGPGNAWAVGYKESAEDREGTPALQHWDGARWTQTAVSSSDAWHLVGVSAGGPDDVWIVGNGESPYAAHWNGARWTGSHPYGVAEDYFLSDVATSGGHAWLVGRNASQGVITEWRPQGFRQALSADGYLLAVTAKRGHVWAVGSDAAASSGTSGTPGTPMVWHGTAVSGTEIQSWQREPTPQITGGVLRRVWMVSPSDVWAVGSVSPSADRPETPLVLHYNGASWQKVEAPIPRGRLDGVTAFGPADVWISGIDADHSGQALFLHYDGQKWTPSYGPLLREHDDGQQYEESDDIARTGIARIPGTSSLWAVGSVGGGDAEDDFVLRHG